MAGGSAASGVSTFSGTLAAATVDTIIFADRYGYVYVQNTGTGTILATADGTTPSTAAGAASGVAIAAGTSVVLANGLKSWDQSSNVILAGTSVIPQGGGAAPAATSASNTGPNPGTPGLTQPFMSSGYGKTANPGTTIKLISTGTPTYTVSGTG